MIVLDNRYTYMDIGIIKFAIILSIMGRFRLEDIIDFMKFVFYPIKKMTKLELKNHTLGSN